MHHGAGSIALRNVVLSCKQTNQHGSRHLVERALGLSLTELDAGDDKCVAHLAPDPSMPRMSPMATGVPSVDRERELERALKQAQTDAALGWGRYHELSNRRVVRAALALARVRSQFAGRRPARARREKPAPEPSPAEPAPTSVKHHGNPYRDSAIPNPGPDPRRDEVKQSWEPGHYYSPVPDTRELGREPARSRIWPADPPECPGIDFRGAEQVALARAIGADSPIVFPTASTGDPTLYHTGNEMFSLLDAWALQGVLRQFRPQRMIEVGCGFSSLVTAQVNRDFLGCELEFTCIEPYPPDFLDEGIEGISRLITSPVQEVALARFEQLRSNDVLFIDTSHVAKTGGDVPFLYHEVLPRLRPGVVVHIHDIFLPWDYPEDWVLGGRAWNEQYLVKSFLAFNRTYEVLLGIGWLCTYRPDVLAGAAPGNRHPKSGPGASLWLRRRTD